MGFDKLKFQICQLSRFIQYIIGYTDFSDIMKKCDVLYILNNILTVTEGFCQLGAVLCNPDGMSLGISVLCVDGICDGGNCLQGKPFYLPCFLGKLLLKLFLHLRDFTEHGFFAA